MNFLVDGTSEGLRIKASEVIVNENSLDMNFRVESNNNANMLKVDAGTDRVGIGTASPTVTLDVAGNANIAGTLLMDDQLYIDRSDGIPSANVRSFKADNGYQPSQLNLVRYGTTSATATPSSSTVGEIRWAGLDSDSTYANFASITATIGSNASGGAPTTLAFAVGNTGATATEKFRIMPGSTVVNESSADHDFRVESNGNANMLFVDGGNDRVGIGTSAPGQPLEIFSNTAEVSLNSSASSYSRFVHKHNGTAMWTVGTRTGDDYHIFRESGSGNVVIDNGNLEFADNGLAVFGAGSDLRIYHNGSNSYIDESGTGALIFKSNIYSFRNAADSETIALFTENGSVDLYYDNSKKLETTSTGINVTGIVTSDQPAFNGQSSLSTGSDGGTTYTTVVANNVNVNRGSHYNTSTGVWTCPVAGVYKVSFYTISITAGADGVFKLTTSQLFKNGAAVWGTPYGYSDGYSNHSGEWHVDCAANDTLEVKTYNSLGGYNGINITLLG